MTNKEKRSRLSTCLFIVGFILTYLAMCYLPGLRIKLAADPWVYFIESIKNSWILKIITSTIVGFLLALIPRFINMKNKSF